MEEYLIKENGSSTKVEIKKDLVASLVDKLKPIVLDETAMGKSIIFDMDGVEMIDSIGIGFLVASHNSANKHGSTIKVVNLSMEILELFKSMQLDKHFQLEGA